MDLHLLTELLLYTGYVAEATTLFCLSDELSSNLRLCDIIVHKTEGSILPQLASEGNYTKVNDLITYYRYLKTLVPSDKILWSCCHESYGPAHWALYNDHIDVYRLLRKNMDVLPLEGTCEETLPELLGIVVGCISDEATMLVLNEVTLELCTPTDIKNITKRLREAFEFQCEDKLDRESSYRDHWMDILCHVAFKLKIKPEDYMNTLCDIYRKDFAEMKKWHLDRYSVLGYK